MGLKNESSGTILPQQCNNGLQSDQNHSGFLEIMLQIPNVIKLQKSCESMRDTSHQQRGTAFIEKEKFAKDLQVLKLQIAMLEDYAAKLNSELEEIEVYDDKWSEQFRDIQTFIQFGRQHNKRAIVVKEIESLRKAHALFLRTMILERVIGHFKLQQELSTYSDGNFPEDLQGQAKHLETLDFLIQTVEKQLSSNTYIPEDFDLTMMQHQAKEEQRLLKEVDCINEEEVQNKVTTLTQQIEALKFQLSNCLKAELTCRSTQMFASLGFKVHKIEIIKEVTEEEKERSRKLKELEDAIESFNMYHQFYKDRLDLSLSLEYKLEKLRYLTILQGQGWQDRIFQIHDMQAEMEKEARALQEYFNLNKSILKKVPQDLIKSVENVISVIMSKSSIGASEIAQMTSKIINELRPFNFCELHHQLRETIAVTNQLQKYQKVVVFFSQSGMGKTTSLLYLAGEELFQNQFNEIEAKPLTKLKNVQINREANNDRIQMSIVTINDSRKQPIAFCDTVGLSGSNSVEIDFAKTMLLHKALKLAKSIVPIFFFSYDDFGSRFSGLKSLIQQYGKLLSKRGNIKQFTENVLFFFTRYPISQLQIQGDQHPSKQIIYRLEDIERNNRVNEDQHYLGMLEILKEHAKENKIIFINPLKGEEIPKILSKIQNNDVIMDPSTKFNLEISEQIKEKLINQIENIVEVLELGLKMKRFDVANFQLDELLACVSKEVIDFLESSSQGKFNIQTKLAKVDEIIYKCQCQYLQDFSNLAEAFIVKEISDDQINALRDNLKELEKHDTILTKMKKFRDIPIRSQISEMFILAMQKSFDQTISAHSLKAQEKVYLWPLLIKNLGIIQKGFSNLFDNALLQIKEHYRSQISSLIKSFKEQIKVEFQSIFASDTLEQQSKIQMTSQNILREILSAQAQDLLEDRNIASCFDFLTVLQRSLLMCNEIQEKYQQLNFKEEKLINNLMNDEEIQIISKAINGTSILLNSFQIFKDDSMDSIGKQWLALLKDVAIQLKLKVTTYFNQLSQEALNILSNNLKQISRVNFFQKKSLDAYSLQRILQTIGQLFRAFQDIRMNNQSLQYLAKIAKEVDSHLSKISKEVRTQLDVLINMNEDEKQTDQISTHSIKQQNELQFYITELLAYNKVFLWPDHDCFAEFHFSIEHVKPVIIEFQRASKDISTYIQNIQIEIYMDKQKLKSYLNDFRLQRFLKLAMEDFNPEGAAEIIESPKIWFQKLKEILNDYKTLLAQLRNGEAIGQSFFTKKEYQQIFEYYNFQTIVESCEDLMERHDYQSFELKKLNQLLKEVMIKEGLLIKSDLDTQSRKLLPRVNQHWNTKTNLQECLSEVKDIVVNIHTHLKTISYLRQAYPRFCQFLLFQPNEDEDFIIKETSTMFQEVKMALIKFLGNVQKRKPFDLIEDIVDFYIRTNISFILADISHDLEVVQQIVKEDKLLLNEGSPFKMDPPHRRQSKNHNLSQFMSFTELSECYDITAQQFYNDLHRKSSHILKENPLDAEELIKIVLVLKNLFHLKGESKQAEAEYDNILKEVRKDFKICHDNIKKLLHEHESEYCDFEIIMMPDHITKITENGQRILTLLNGIENHNLLTIEGTSSKQLASDVIFAIRRLLNSYINPMLQIFTKISHSLTKDNLEEGALTLIQAENASTLLNTLIKKLPEPHQKFELRSIPIEGSKAINDSLPFKQAIHAFRSLFNEKYDVDWANLRGRVIHSGGGGEQAQQYADSTEIFATIDHCRSEMQTQILEFLRIIEAELEKIKARGNYEKPSQVHHLLSNSLLKNIRYKRESIFGLLMQQQQVLQMRIAQVQQNSRDITSIQQWVQKLIQEQIDSIAKKQLLEAIARKESQSTAELLAQLFMIMFTTQPLFSLDIEKLIVGTKSYINRKIPKAELNDFKIQLRSHVLQNLDQISDYQKGRITSLLEDEVVIDKQFTVIDYKKEEITIEEILDNLNDEDVEKHILEHDLREIFDNYDQIINVHNVQALREEIKSRKYPIKWSPDHTAAELIKYITQLITCSFREKSFAQFKPSNLQMTAILLGLGIGVKFKQAFENALIRLLPGEGRSFVLATISIVLALHSQAVTILVLNEEIAQQNRLTYEAIFKDLGVQELIQYESFTGALQSKSMVQYINERESLFSQMVLKNKPGQSDQQQISPKQPQVQRVALLVEDIDMFLNVNKYQRSLKICINSEETQKLIKNIWNSLDANNIQKGLGRSKSFKQISSIFKINSIGECLESCLQLELQFFEEEFDNAEVIQMIERESGSLKTFLREEFEKKQTERQDLYLAAGTVSPQLKMLENFNQLIGFTEKDNQNIKQTEYFKIQKHLMLSQSAEKIQYQQKRCCSNTQEFFKNIDSWVENELQKENLQQGVMIVVFENQGILDGYLNPIHSIHVKTKHVVLNKSDDQQYQKLALDRGSLLLITVEELNYIATNFRNQTLQLASKQIGLEVLVTFYEHQNSVLNNLGMIMKANKVAFSALILDEESAALYNKSEEELKQNDQWSDEVEENLIRKRKLADHMENQEQDESINHQMQFSSLSDKDPQQKSLLQIIDALNFKHLDRVNASKDIIRLQIIFDPENCFSNQVELFGSHCVKIFDALNKELPQEYALAVKVSWYSAFDEHYFIPFTTTWEFNSTVIQKQLDLSLRQYRYQKQQSSLLLKELCTRDRVFKRTCELLETNLLKNSDNDERKKIARLTHIVFVESDSKSGSSIHSQSSGSSGIYSNGAQGPDPRNERVEELKESEESLPLMRKVSLRRRLSSELKLRPEFSFSTIVLDSLKEHNLTNWGDHVVAKLNQCLEKIKNKNESLMMRQVSMFTEA